MTIEKTCRKFGDLDKSGVENDSLKLNFYIIFINETNSPVFKKPNIFWFKNN